MRKAAFVLGLLGLLSPSTLQAEGVAIDHATVGCVVAGQYPRLNACFAPRSGLARARVYFRVADAPPDWYYVEMASNSPCHAGILPRPKKELVGRRIQYYVDAFDRSFTESRTPEAEALVVASASECHSKLPVAPVVNSATVAVFPSMPAGFAGGAAAAGLGAGATAALAVGGAAVVGGGVAMAAGGSGDGSASTPTTTLPPVGEVPTTTVPTTTTTTTTLVSGFSPSFRVLDGSTLVAGDAIVGNEPLVLRFDMCATVGPYPMRYAVEVDGVIETNGCNSFVTFTTASASSDVQGSAVRRSATSRTYVVRMTIQSDCPEQRPEGVPAADGSGEPRDAASTGGCSTDKQGPVVTLTKPSSGSLYPSPNPYPVHFEASASDATTGNNGVAFVEYKVNYPGPSQLILGPVTSGSPWPYDWTESAVNAYLGTACAKFLEVQAYAQDSCGNASYSAKVQVIVNSTGPCTRTRSRVIRRGRDHSQRAGRAGRSSPGRRQRGGGLPARGPQLSRPPRRTPGKPGRGDARRGPIRRDVAFRARGRTGLPSREPSRRRGGEVLQLAGDSVTFRLQGRPGERVVFASGSGSLEKGGPESHPPCPPPSARPS